MNEHSEARATTALLDVRDGSLLRLTKINAQDRYGISLATISELKAHFAAANTDPGISVILIDVAGERQFHEGAMFIWEIQPDVDRLTDSDFRTIHQHIKSLCDAMANCRCPVVVSARAGALGAGLETMLPADFIYCYDDAQFSQPEVAVGLVAGGGGTQRLVSTLPLRRAQEMLLLGVAIDGDEAAAHGLVTRAYPRGDAYEAALEELLARLASLPPKAVAATKQALNQSSALAGGLERERDAFILAATSGEFAAWKKARDGSAVTTD